MFAKAVFWDAMKSILFATLILATSVTAFSFTSSDTLKPVSFSYPCAWKFDPNNGSVPDLVVYKNPMGGYVCGNSVYGIKAKAQKYYNEGGGMLTYVALIFGEKKQAPFPGLIRVKVYNVDPVSGAPDSVLAESSTMSVGNIKASVTDIDSVKKWNFISFPDSFPVPDTFFVALDLTMLAPGDSVGLLSTKDSCFSGEQLAWEQNPGNSWSAFGTPASWSLNIDMAMFPIGDFGLSTSVPSIGRSKESVYPNPASNKVIIRGDWPVSQNKTISIYDLQGRLMKQQAIPDNARSIELSTNDLSGGMYFYRVNTGFLTNGKLLIKR